MYLQKEFTTDKSKLSESYLRTREFFESFVTQSVFKGDIALHGLVVNF
jgi:hypothetical protein